MTDYQINKQLKELKERLYDFIEVQYIFLKSSRETKSTRNAAPSVTEELMENYLKKRGYIQNVMMGTKILTKGFVCVSVSDKSVNIWHDIPKAKVQTITQSYLTGLPIALDYMERI